MAGGDPHNQPTEELPSSSPAGAEATTQLALGYQRGDTIGRYRILSVIGEGGFGVVYLAEQTEPVTRRVALKVIKPGMDSKQVIARFEAERQALALMRHPNVARVFDGGATDDGRPYFVMEHVPGESITDHCDRQKLSIGERLALFIKVCDAVQHAHQKGVIHRDIKPLNILVEYEDGKATPKIIDFGIAKALDHKLTEATIFTDQGQLIGTPAYMSPEQAEMSATDIDTRSDIYSLGVLLYELLTGALPFDPESLRKAAFAEIQRIIRETEPPRPSTKLSSLGDESAMSANQRRVDPRSLVRELRGDLDWITMKALEKDRARRYDTAGAFAADIRRHLNHEPVLAGPPSAAYRMRKFIRRNRTGVLAGTVVAGAFFAATGVSIGFALSEAEQRALAEDREREARTQAEIAVAVNNFLNNDLLAAVAPSAELGKGKDVSMRDVLDAASKKIEDAAAPGGRFSGKPLIEASIRATLGETYRRLGEYAVAEPHLKRARVLRHRVLGEEHPDTLSSMNILAILYDNQGRYDEAQPLYVKTLDIQKRVLGEEHPDTLTSMNSLANLYRNQGRYDEAEPLYVKTLEIIKRVRGEEHSHTLNSMNNLALLYWNLGRFDEAEPLYIQTLEIMKRILGEAHPDTLDSTKNLANLYKDEGRYDEAEPLYLQTLEIQKRVLGDEHPNTLVSMNNLAELYHTRARYEEAATLFAQAVAGAREAWPARHWITGAILGGYGQTLNVLQRYEEAETALLEAHGLIFAGLGPDNERTIGAIKSLSDLYTAWHEAEPNKGYDAKAAEWRAEFESLRGETDGGTDNESNGAKSGDDDTGNERD